MKFATLAAALLAIPAAFAANSTTVSVSYDEVYDNASGSLSTVACSDGENGMLTKGPRPNPLNLFHCAHLARCRLHDVRVSPDVP